MHTLWGVLCTLGVCVGVFVSVRLGYRISCRIRKGLAAVLAIAALGVGFILAMHFSVPGMAYSLPWTIGFWLVWFSGGILAGLRK